MRLMLAAGQSRTGVVRFPLTLTSNTGLSSALAAPGLERVSE